MDLASFSPVCLPSLEQTWNFADHPSAYVYGERDKVLLNANFFGHEKRFLIFVYFGSLHQSEIYFVCFLYS